MIADLFSVGVDILPAVPGSEELKGRKGTGNPALIPYLGAEVPSVGPHYQYRDGAKQRHYSPNCYDSNHVVVLLCLYCNTSTTTL